MSDKTKKPTVGAEKNIAITAERAMAILELLERFDYPVPLKQITEKIGLSQTAVFRLISTLERSGFVQRSNYPKGYTLGWRIASMANTMLRQMAHIDAVNVVLAELADKTGQTASMHMLSGYSTICVASYEGAGRLVYKIPIGQAAPVLRGAAGKAILAFSLNELPQAIKAAERGLQIWNLAPSEVPSVKDLSSIRDTGLSFSKGELVPGVESLATPVFSGPSSTVIGSISVSGPSQEWHRATMVPWFDLLRTKAVEVSESFGSTSPPAWTCEPS